MRSFCSALQVLCMGLGSYVAAAIVAILQAISTAGGGPGWIATNVNQARALPCKWCDAAGPGIAQRASLASVRHCPASPPSLHLQGHLDYFFLTMMCLMLLNLCLFVFVARRFRYRKLPHATVSAQPGAEMPVPCTGRQHISHLPTHTHLLCQASQVGVEALALSTDTKSAVVLGSFAASKSEPVPCQGSNCMQARGDRKCKERCCVPPQGCAASSSRACCAHRPCTRRWPPGSSCRARAAGCFAARWRRRLLWMGLQRRRCAAGARSASNRRPRCERCLV